MSQFAASNVTLTALQTGADFLSDDDTYMRINGFKFGMGGAFQNFSEGLVNLTRGVGTHEMRTGDTAQLFPLTGGTTIGDGVLLSNKSILEVVPFANSISFDVYDQDSPITEGSDDFIGTTTYVANGREPLLEHGKFHFVNIMSRSGSTYRLEYDINKLPGSVTGKLATADGGLLNGSNKDGTLVGQGGKDIINANDGDDLVMGNGNDDTLNGGKGDDLIFGGKGNDRLSGGQGFDTFILARKDGFDTVKDFRAGSDHIGLGSGLTFEDLTLVQQAKGTLVKAGGEQLGFLQATKANQLSAADFTQLDMASLNSLVRSNVAQLS